MIDALVQIIITQGITGPEKRVGLCEQLDYGILKMCKT